MATQASSQIQTKSLASAVTGKAEMEEPTVNAMNVTDLDFYYGKAHALHKIAMPVPKQRVTALIGPSGCGKSTFLRSLNRMNDHIDGVRV